MRLRTLSTILSDVLSHLPGAEYERAKREALAAQVKEQRAHTESLARRLEYTTRQKDEAEERESKTAKAHDEALKAACEAVKVACDHAKTSYEAEKAAHGETQRHLTAATAERDGALTAMKMADAVRLAAREDHDRKIAAAEESAEHWRGFAVERLNLLADMERERDALRARVAELQSGEPAMNAIFVQGKIVGGFADRARTEQVAKDTWTNYTIEPLFRSQPAAPVVGGEPVAWMVERKWPDSAHFCTIHEANARSFVDGGTTVTPLYAAPQPAAPAHGVEEERFVCLLDEQCMTIANRRETGTRSEAEGRTMIDGDAKVMRLVDADAPVVDVDAIRKALSVLDGYSGNAQLEKVAARVRAAIGEKA